MALNHDLVMQTFDAKSPKDHVRILADHADENGHPELAEAFRNEEKSVNPYPWYDDDYASEDGERGYSRIGYMAGDPVASSVTPLEHVKKVKTRGLQLAPNIYAMKGYDGFAPSRGYVSFDNSGFHVYNFTNLPDEEDQPGFGSRSLHNMALEEHFEKNPPRFFKHKGKLELARTPDPDRTALVYRALEDKNFGILADYFDERGAPTMAKILRRHKPVGAMGPSDSYDQEYAQRNNPYSLQHYNVPYVSPTEYLAQIRKGPQLAPDVHLVKSNNKRDRGFYLYDLRNAPSPDHDLDYNADHAVGDWLDNDAPQHFFPSSTEKLDLARAPQDPWGYKGWVAPDGTFHSNASSISSGTHYTTLARLGLDGRDYTDYSKAYEAGYAHLADDMDFGSETGNKIHLHHPKIQYTEMQLATLKRLAKREGTGASVMTRINGKPGTRELKLSRASALTDQLSMQQRIRRALVVKIAREARLRLTSLADGRTSQNAGVLQTYGHDNDPKGVEYAAAWYGLLTKAPATTAFHVHQGGPDTFHSWTTMMDPDNTLRVAGNLPAVVTSDGRVSIFDQGNKLANHIAKFKEASFAQNPQAEAGTAVSMGGREAFRATIREYQGG